MVVNLDIANSTTPIMQVQRLKGDLQANGNYIDR
jgi:hypothetical protein